MRIAYPVVRKAIRIISKWSSADYRYCISTSHTAMIWQTLPASTKK